MCYLHCHIVGEKKNISTRAMKHKWGIWLGTGGALEVEARRRSAYGSYDTTWNVTVNPSMCILAAPTLLLLKRAFWKHVCITEGEVHFGVTY